MGLAISSGHKIEAEKGLFGAVLRIIKDGFETYLILDEKELKELIKILQRIEKSS